MQVKDNERTTENRKEIVKPEVMCVPEREGKREGRQGYASNRSNTCRQGDKREERS